MPNLMVLAADYDGGSTKLAVYDADTSTRLLTPGLPTMADLVCLGFSPDGDRLYAGGYQFGTPGIYALETTNFSEAGTFTPAFADQALALAVRSTGDMVAFSGYDPLLQMYDPATLTGVTGPATPPDVVVKMAFSPSGAQLAMALGGPPRLQVRNVSGWTSVTLGTALAANPSWVDWSPTGTRVALTTFGTPRFVVYNTSGWTQIATGVTGSISSTCCVFSPDGSKLALAGPSTGQSIGIYDTTTWAMVGSVTGIVDSINVMRFSPDGAVLAVGINGAGTGGPGSDYFRRYDTTTWAQLPDLAVMPEYRVYDIAFGATVAPPAVPFWTNYVRSKEIP